MDQDTRVFIVCCNRLLRESVARILSKKAGFEVVATQATQSSSLDEISGARIDVLVLDSLDFMIAGQADGPLLSSLWPFPCVLIAMQDDRAKFLRAVQCGARGYVLQDASAADVVSAIRAVAQGQAVCPAEYTRELFDFVASQADRAAARFPARVLTARERQLVPLIGQGLSNKEIAQHFHLSEQTVKNHIHRMMRKMGVESRLELCGHPQSLMPTASTKADGYSAGYQSSQ